MRSADEALALILARVVARPPERVPLAEALGRALAEELIADLDLPPFDNAAMDGYAVRAADTAGARASQPATLRVLEDVSAGRVAGQTVTPGTAVRIMTGAPLPAGADAVIRFEETETAPGEVRVRKEVASGYNVRPRGEDVRAGQRILSAGTDLGPAEMGVLASLGRAQVPVVQRPRVAIITTGDELVGVDEPLRPGQIRDSNSYTLLGQVQRCGGVVQSLRRAVDTRAALRQAFADTAEADVILTSGGVSVGDYDLVKEVVEELGEIVFWRVAIKPGKPLLFGQLDQRLVFGLPGNPVSSMVTFEVFVRPALRRMSGFRAWRRQTVTARLRQDHRSSPQRLEYVRAWTKFVEGEWQASLTGAQGSGRLSSMLGANSYLLIPPEVGQARAGETYPALLLDQPEIE